VSVEALSIASPIAGRKNSATIASAPIAVVT
jgi:hypothetical protein